MDASAVRGSAADLPVEPGVYQFRASDPERVLYVGKAVDLRERVRSYADPRSARIGEMVAAADTIEVAVTDTETQALLLEANLIKRHRPRYNVRLKDDKSYPLVQLTDHAFPRVEITRDPAEGATVYGPFTDKGQVETVVKALRDVYGVRGCSEHKYANRDRPCIDYDIGLCSAPCTDEIDRDSYRDDVLAVERFFQGETGVLAGPLRREMETAAEAERFERAANLRDRLDAVESFHGTGGGAVTSSDAGEGPAAVDVLGVALAGSDATVARLHAEGGKLLERDQHSLETTGREDVAAVLGAFLTQYYAERDLPDAILCPERPVGKGIEAWLSGAGVDLRVPGAGREATLVELAIKNASRTDRRDDESRALAAALDLSGAARIEGFDVSHAGGRAVVGSNVCFVDGDPEKSGYRRKKLPDGNDDYASMSALVRWRGERAIEGRDDRPDPDLLVVDGGRGQLDAARDALDTVGWEVPAIALAKAEERVVTPEGSHDWDDDAPELHLLQRVRDEAHRFARQYHESVRDEVSTPLDDIDGVGPQTRRRLLRRFGTVAAVRDASKAELRAVDGVGETTATKLARRL
ncbi:MAG: excinuclease ABC subunit C [Haloarculaceae archaeon]